MDRLRPFVFTWFVAALALGVGCGESGSKPGVEAPVGASEDAVSLRDAASLQDAVSAPPTAEVSIPYDASRGTVRAGDLGISVDAVALRRVADGELHLTVRGRSTRKLTGIQSYVPDDGFGDARLRGPRSFEVELRDGHEVNTVLSGAPLYLHLEVATEPPTQYDARLVLAPSLAPAGSPTLDGGGSLPGPSGGLGAGLTPTYGRDRDNPILYRARVQSDGSSLDVVAAARPRVVSAGDGVFHVDWAYPALETILRERQPTVVFVSDGRESRTTLEARVVSLGLTTLGTTAAWPEPVCEAATWRCVRELPDSAEDYSACGSYHAVARCAFADACEVLGAPQPLTLSERDGIALLDEAITAFNAQFEPSDRAGAWRSVRRARAYDYPWCVEAAPSLEQLLPLVLAASAEHDQGTDLGPGTRLPRATLVEHPFFVGAEGAALLGAVDRLAGGANGNETSPVAQLYLAPVPCPNCTDHLVRVVLFYAATRTLVVLDGTYGYDS